MWYRRTGGAGLKDYRRLYIQGIFLGAFIAAGALLASSGEISPADTSVTDSFVTLTSAEMGAADSDFTEVNLAGSNPVETSQVDANFAELNSTEPGDVPVEGAFNFMVSMLELAELNTRLINATLSSRVSDYPFLATTIEGTSEGVEYMDSVLAYLGSEQQVLDENNFTDEAFTDALLANESVNESINESFNDSINDSIVETIVASLGLLNESLESPQQMMDNANSTLGAEEETTELIASMYESVKLMVSKAG